MRRNKGSGISADGVTKYEIPIEDVNTLCSGLEDANEQFRRADKGGRIGVIWALSYTIDFLNQIQPVAKGQLALPLLVLASALEALDQKSVQPLLAPSKPDNRPPGAGLRITIKATAIWMSEILADLGIQSDDAYARVAKVLNDNGVESHGSRKPIAARTIRGWKEDIAADIARETKLAKAFWQLKNSSVTPKFHRGPRATSEKLALLLLGQVIRRIRAGDAR